MKWRCWHPSGQKYLTALILRIDMMFILSTQTSQQGEEVDGLEDDVNYNHNDGDQNQDCYFYDDDDGKGPLEGSATRSMIPKPPPVSSTDGRVKLVFRKDEETGH